MRELSRGMEISLYLEWDGGYHQNHSAFKMCILLYVNHIPIKKELRNHMPWVPKAPNGDLNLGLPRPMASSHEAARVEQEAPGNVPVW